MLLLYVSVLVHELSHCVVARGFGLPVRRILLYPLGGFSEIEQEPPRPAGSSLVSGAGPAAVPRAGRDRLRLAIEVVPARRHRPDADRPAVRGEPDRRRSSTCCPACRWTAAGCCVRRVWKVTGRPGTGPRCRPPGRAGCWPSPARRAAEPIFGQRSGSSRSACTWLWLLVIAASSGSSATQAIQVARIRERLPAVQARRLARHAIPRIGQPAAGRGGQARRRGRRPGAGHRGPREQRRSRSSTRPRCMATPEAAQAVDRGRLAGPDARAPTWCCPPTCPAWT